MFYVCCLGKLTFSSSRRATGYAFTGAVPHEVYTVVSSVSHCAGLQNTRLVFGTALRPISTRGMQVIGLGVLQALCRCVSTDSLQSCFGNNHYSYALASAMGTVESFQCQPCLCVCPPTKTAAATTGPTAAVGALITHSEVHQVLSSQTDH